MTRGSRTWNWLGEHCEFRELAQRVSPRRWCVLGVPVSFDSPDPLRGAAGPEEIRRALPYLWPHAPRRLWDPNLRTEVETRSGLPLDLGNVRYDRRLDRAADVEERITLAVAEICRLGGRPLVLGGEHWLTEPAIRGVLTTAGELHVIHFDAHTDTDRASFAGAVPPPLRNSNVFSFVGRHGGVRRILQIGVREFDPIAPAGADVAGAEKFTVVGSEDVVRGASPGEVFADIPTGSSVYVSVDADVLDPSLAPEVGWPVPGGLALSHLTDLLSHALRTYKVVGLDLVEVFGGGESNLAAMAMARCLLLFVLQRAQMPVAQAARGPAPDAQSR